MIRADFTTHGWSLQADLGGRLRYGDAIALLEQIIGDPSTYTGAEINGLDYPARWGEIPVVYALGSDEYPKPFDSLRNDCGLTGRRPNVSGCANRPRA